MPRNGDKKRAIIGKRIAQRSEAILISKSIVAGGNGRGKIPKKNPTIGRTFLVHNGR